MANALTTAKEFLDAGDDVALVFDGAGVTWIPHLADPEQKYHKLFGDIRGAVRGACLYCSRAYGVKEDVEAAGVPFLDDFRDHPSVRSLVADGYQVITF